MFAIILFTILLFLNPSGKLLEYWSWNQQIVKTEWVQSKFENKKTFLLTAQKIDNLLTSKTLYFFDFHLIPFFEKIAKQEITNLYFTQNKVYVDLQIQRLALCKFNIQYPIENYKIETIK
jgi:hypothetical protein